jgi:hypothetical protein
LDCIAPLLVTRCTKPYGLSLYIAYPGITHREKVKPSRTIVWIRQRFCLRSRYSKPSGKRSPVLVYSAIFQCPISHDLIRTYHVCCLMVKQLTSFQAQIFDGYEDKLQREGGFIHSDNDIERGVHCLHLYLLRDHFGTKVHPDSLGFMKKAMAVVVTVECDSYNYLY